MQRNEQRQRRRKKISSFLSVCHLAKSKRIYDDADSICAVLVQTKKKFFEFIAYSDTWKRAQENQQKKVRKI